MSGAAPFAFPNIQQNIQGVNVTGGSQSSTGINITYAAPQGPPAPLIPGFIDPISRDPHFVEHGDLLARIAERCSQPAGRVGLIGLGGVGKTQLAIEYAHRVRDKSPDTWIFWVLASSKARVRQAFERIAKNLKLHIPEGEVEPLSASARVGDWLADESNGKWLMIVDSADYLESVQGPFDSTEDDITLRRTIPQSRNGAVLITSRNRDVVLDMVSDADILQVDTMDGDAAAQLFHKKVHASPGPIVNSLLTALNHFPLAITQATAYMNRLKISAYEYLRRFAQEEERIKLLEKGISDFRHHEKVPRSILRTWLLSFEQLRSENPDAVDMLLCMSFFNCDSIPRRIIQFFRIPFPDNVPDRKYNDGHIIDENIDEIIAKLHSFSLISNAAKKNNFKVHALVQLATRAWMNSMGMEVEGHYWCSFQTLLLHAVSKLKMLELSPEEYYHELAPHADAHFERRPSTKEEAGLWAEIQIRVALIMESHGSDQHARPVFQSCFTQFERFWGIDNSETLRFADHVARNMVRTGDFDKAINFSRDVLAKYRTRSGGDDRHTQQLLDRIREYSGIVQRGNRFLKLHLLIQKGMLGPLHPETHLTQQALVEGLVLQNKSDEAETLLRQELNIRARTFGECSFEALVSAQQLGAFLVCRGKYKEAEKYTRRALRGAWKRLDPVNPFTLTCMDDLGHSLYHQGKFEEAQAALQWTVAWWKLELEPDHPQILKSEFMLGFVMAQGGYQSAAVRLHSRALNGFYKRFGRCHEQSRRCYKVLDVVIHGRTPDFRHCAGSKLGDEREKNGSQCDTPNDEWETEGPGSGTDDYEWETEDEEIATI